MRPNGGRAAAAGILAAAALLVAAWIIMRSDEGVPLRGTRGTVEASAETVFVTVQPGDTATAIAERLASAGAIEGPASFRLLARLTGSERHLAAGEYEFSPQTSALDALNRIRDGLTSARIVTIPEGLRLEEVGALLERRGIVTAREFIDATEAYPGSAAAPALLASRPPGRSLEGYLFPATYGLPRRVTAIEVVDMMVVALDARLTPDLREEARQRGLSLHEVLTLASIVEREVVRPEERALVASVYLNRLALGMRLQADPTVQYAVADRASGGYWKRELSAQDLQSASPYNTYAHAGLPPGPIGNPGMAAILAVLRPARTSFLYFVARPDGSHAFAASFEEHERNVERFRPRDGSR